TKSGRSRSFPMHADLRRLLGGMARSGDGRIFPGPKDGRLKPDTVRQGLVPGVVTPLSERFPTPAGQGGVGGGRLPSVRHYLCSTCANSGVPEQVVMEWLGHADSAMVRRYYHLHDDEAQRQMRRLDFLGEAGGGGAAGTAS